MRFQERHKGSIAKRQAAKSVVLDHDFDFVNHEKSVFVFQIFLIVYNDLATGFLEFV